MISFRIVTLSSALFLALTALACGGGGGGGGSQYEICVASCEKSDECTGSSTDCAGSCAHLQGMANPCLNAAEQEAAQWACINGECGPNGDTFNTCIYNAPQCEFP